MKQEIPVSLSRRADAQNVRLYYPYQQFTNLFIFRFVCISTQYTTCLRSTLCLYELDYSFECFPMLKIKKNRLIYIYIYIFKTARIFVLAQMLHCGNMRQRFKKTDKKSPWSSNHVHYTTQVQYSSYCKKKLGKFKIFYVFFTNELYFSLI